MGDNLVRAERLYCLNALVVRGRKNERDSYWDRFLKVEELRVVSSTESSTEHPQTKHVELQCRHFIFLTFMKGNQSFQVFDTIRDSQKEFEQNMQRGKGFLLRRYFPQ